jgi:hypothetical protein
MVRVARGYQLPIEDTSTGKPTASLINRRLRATQGDAIWGIITSNPDPRNILDYLKNFLRPLSDSQHGAVLSALHSCRTPLVGNNYGFCGGDEPSGVGGRDFSCFIELVYDPQVIAKQNLPEECPTTAVGCTPHECKRSTMAI